MNAIIFLTDGFEEIEALAPADILRRGGVAVELVSLTGRIDVVGSHGITVKTDRLFAEPPKADMLILPGGPGADAFISHTGLVDALMSQYKSGGYLAAICAAPVTLGRLGLLKDRTAVCYPSMEDKLGAAMLGTESVVVDGNIITGRAAGAALDFGLALLGALAGAEAAQRVRVAMVI